MKQLFEVGEIVVRQADDYPEGNGEYEVLSVIGTEEMRKLHPYMTLTPDHNYYEIQGFMVQLPNGYVAYHSAEMNLRKRHTKGDMSFKELMSDLKTNIQERIS